MSIIVFEHILYRELRPWLYSRSTGKNNKDVKQWGGTNKKKAGRILDGQTWDEMPEAKP